MIGFGEGRWACGNVRRAREDEGRGVRGEVRGQRAEVGGMGKERLVILLVLRGLAWC